MLNIILLGPPGGGKGSQAQRLSPALGLPHISTGDMLRAAIREKTPLGLEAQEIISSGNLVPDGVMLGIVEQRILQQDCQNGFILDGFPRTIAQAEALESMTVIHHALNIAAADDVIIKRLSGRRSCKNNHTSHIATMENPDICPICGAPAIQREDDKPSTIENRLMVYKENTAPLIEYYQDKGILHTLDGAASIEDVYKAIQEVLS